MHGPLHVRPCWSVRKPQRWKHSIRHPTPLLTYPQQRENGLASADGSRQPSLLYFLFFFRESAPSRELFSKSGRAKETNRDKTAEKGSSRRAGRRKNGVTVHATAHCPGVSSRPATPLRGAQRMIERSAAASLLCPRAGRRQRGAEQRAKRGSVIFARILNLFITQLPRSGCFRSRDLILRMTVHRMFEDSRRGA